MCCGKSSFLVVKGTIITLELLSLFLLLLTITQGLTPFCACLSYTENTFDNSTQYTSPFEINVLLFLSSLVWPALLIYILIR